MSRRGATRNAAAAAVPRALTNAALDRALHALQADAFAQYEQAALVADASPKRATQVYADVEARVAPLIEQARVLNDERVRRLRHRARRWRIATWAVLAVGLAGIGWLLLLR